MRYSAMKASFNHYAGEDCTMTVWSFADHGGGHGSNPPVQLAWLRERTGGAVLTWAPYRAWTADLR